MKNVLITGATRGLGKVMADTFQLQGHNVVRHGRNEGDVTGDITSVSTVNKIAYRLKRDNIDVFINNAGRKPKNDTLLEAVETSVYDTINTNIVGQIALIRCVYNFFVKRGHGQIVNINSMFCKNPNKSEPIYGASKMAIRGLLQALSIESQGTNVNILDIFLGATHTDMTVSQERPMITCLEAAKVITDLILINTETCYLNEVVIRSNTI